MDAQQRLWQFSMHAYLNHSIHSFWKKLFNQINTKRWYVHVRESMFRWQRGSVYLLAQSFYLSSKMGSSTWHNQMFAMLAESPNYARFLTYAKPSEFSWPHIIPWAQLPQWLTFIWPLRPLISLFRRLCGQMYLGALKSFKGSRKSKMATYFPLQVLALA
ncbi:unannotated protein [freshwater metagenome]|uniref:Unannotated protein n=1 Tax=freshwater metagenome TaxID=449393 RepID=A0A6J6Q619_9ZZZZ